MRLWITYARVDNDDGDLDYVVRRLEEAGVEAQYDRVSLVPGRRLWEQLADRISDPGIDGWSYLLTPASIASQACMEELAYAVDRALHTRDFPIIGLASGVPFAAAPLAIRVRLGVSLSSVDWPGEVVAALRGVPPAARPASVSQFRIRVTPGVPGAENVLEFTPRLETVHHWIVGVPDPITILRHATGAAGHGFPTASFEQNTWRQTGAVHRNRTWNICGSAGPISPTTSAYVRIDDVPDEILNGYRDSPDRYRTFFNVPGQ